MLFKKWILNFKILSFFEFVGVNMDQSLYRSFAGHSFFVPYVLIWKRTLRCIDCYNFLNSLFWVLSELFQCLGYGLLGGF